MSRKKHSKKGILSDTREGTKMQVNEKLKILFMSVLIEFCSISYADTTETDTLVFPGWLSAKLNYTVVHKGPYTGSVKAELGISKSQGICFLSLHKDGGDNMKADIYLNQSNNWMVDVASGGKNSSVTIECLKWVQ